MALSDSLNQTILGFDPGTRKIGVAVGDTLIKQATPLQRLSVVNGLPPLAELQKLFQQWRPHILVVGMPTRMDGSSQFTTRIALALIEFLKHQTNIPVYSIDERLTTKIARSELFELGGLKKLKKTDVDGYAAKLIVESWIYDHSNHFER